MHEYSVTKELVKIVLDEAENAGITEVSKVKLVLGTLRGFVPESISYYFNIMRQDTSAGKAELQFRVVDGEFQCRDCTHSFILNTISFFCPECNSFNLKTLKGNEFFVETIEGD